MIIKIIIPILTHILPKCCHSQHDCSSSPFKATKFSKEESINLASHHHGLYQGLFFEFQLTYEKCILADKAYQLPLLVYRISSAIKSNITPNELHTTGFSEVID
jgi:hypothetical protein